MTTETRWHRHWTWRPKSKRFASFLRQPRYITTDIAQVMRSRYPYGRLSETTPQMYYLSLLSVLHRWTGVVLYWEDEESGNVDQR